MLAAPRDRYVYFPDTQSVPYFAAPKVLNRPHSITADVEIPADGAEGVLLCQGRPAGGYTLFVKDGKLALRPQLRGPRATSGSQSPNAVPAGRHQLRFEFEPTGDLDLLQGRGAPGRFQLYIDEQARRRNRRRPTPRP